MAEKKNTKKPIEAAQEAAAQKSAEKKVRESKQVFVPGDEKKLTDAQKEMRKKSLPPQAQVIAKVVAENPDGIGRKDLYIALPKAGLMTRQPVERIFAFYQKRLVEGGYIAVKA